MKSLRQDHLPQEVRDLLAYAWTAGLLPLPLYGTANAVEIRLDDSLHHVLHGGAGFRCHAGSNADEYYIHRHDDRWAEIWHNDCDGDTERGHLLWEVVAAPAQEGPTPDTILTHWPIDLPVPLLCPRPASLAELRARLHHNDTAYLVVHHPDLPQAPVTPGPERTTPC
mgnify:CR=1 FL=1